MALNVDELKAKILDLAVRGKLVDRSKFTEETSTQLIERINLKRDALVKEKKIKKTNSTTSISKEEIPFKIPDNWIFERMSNIVDVRDGTHDSPKYVLEGYPLVTSKNISCGSIDLSSVKFISESDYAKINERSKVDVGDILFAMIGTVGNPVLVIEEPNYAIKNVALFKTSTFGVIEPKYLLYYLKHTEQAMISRSAGGVQKFVSLGFLRGFVVPVPPLNEQKAIVSHIEKFFGIIDTLSFEADLQLKTLDQLRQKTLNLAIRGKLVSQDENDEPASELLARIQSEKDRLIKEKKIKKTAELKPISDDEIPFEIPESWEWIKLNDICEYIQRGKSPKYSSVEEIPVIAQKCIQWSGVTLDKAQFIEPDSIKKYGSERFLIHGDILWNSTGRGSCGRVGIFEDSIRQGYNLIVADSHVTVVRSMQGFINNYYLLLWLKSQEVQSVIESKATGTTNQIELSTVTISNQHITLPPLAEQNRIIKKINNLFQQIDQLESEIKKSINLSDLIA